MAKRLCVDKNEKEFYKPMKEIDDKNFFFVNRISAVKIKNKK